MYQQLIQLQPQFLHFQTFSSLFGFDQRVYVLKKELSQLKQVDYFAQLLETIKSQIPIMIDAQLSTRLEDSIQKAFWSYTAEFEKKAQGEKKRYIDLIEKSMKDIIKDELDKDLFESYGKAYSLKRDQEDKEKDEDPPAGSHQGLKKGRQARMLNHQKALNQKNQSYTDDQPNVEAASESDWFKKPERPPTPDSNWNARISVDFRPPQTWISRIAQAEKPPLTFDELMNTPIDFLAYNNPEGKEYPFDLSKHLPLIEDRGRQVVLVGYFINNDLEYLKGGSSSKKFMTSTTKTKAAKYDDIQGIEDMVPSLWSPMKIAYDGYAIWGITHWVTHVKVMKWYDYGYLEEIEVRRENQKLYKFKEGDFPRLNLCDIDDMMLLLVQKKITNLERDVIFNLNVALRMFTKRVVILKRVEDLQLGVKSYQKKLNITKSKTFRLIRLDELYKFSDGTLTSVRSVLYDIASNLRMDYLPKRRWSNLDK
ncbi:hypothetical protein Tco_1315588 [Tanacetum coccineum]